jgi:ADP-ribose pyrophosphatase YjhB (NUDIX family)
MSNPLRELGVNIAVIQENRILLTRREDMEAWCLPGGAVEFGESLAEAAIRETFEETGLKVELTGLVGLYSRPHFGGHHTAVLFAGTIIGGTFKPDPHEVIEMGFFAPDQLPTDIIWDHETRILDALAGYGGSIVRTTTRTRPNAWAPTRDEAYALRDQSGVSRLEFYRHYASKLDPENSQIEIVGAKQ